MAGTIRRFNAPDIHREVVSMESGLDGRNNKRHGRRHVLARRVSMESGLDGRNNTGKYPVLEDGVIVSMESGLDGRNNET